MIGDSKERAKDEWGDIKLVKNHKNQNQNKNKVLNFMNDIVRV